MGALVGVLPSGGEPGLELFQQAVQVGPEQQGAVLVGAGVVVFGERVFFGRAFCHAFVVVDHLEKERGNRGGKRGVSVP